MQELERIQARLENVRSVEPLLSAMRTISLASWQAALKQKANAQRYAEHLLHNLPCVLPHLGRGGEQAAWETSQDSFAPSRIVTLVIGSERGLCGHFNAALIEYLEGYMARLATPAVRVELEAMGARLVRLMRSRHHPPARWERLSATTLPSPRSAFELTHRWLASYQARELDAVDVLYNAYHGVGRYASSRLRLIPPHLPLASSNSFESGVPPIIETDPIAMYEHIAEQWAAAKLYGLLLESSAAEHSARYQLMEEATGNAQRLVEELTLAIHSARRQAITQEVQELAAGAGLIG
jgi:F-type H+-transporting ATPase subunit gamma